MSFKVGDRVAFYNEGYRFKGKISGADLNKVCVDTDGGKYYCVSPKQCRRLVKKERRRIWIPINSVPPNGSSRERCHINGFKPGDESLFIEFIEVKKK